MQGPSGSAERGSRCGWHKDPAEDEIGDGGLTEV